jgi:hypothetical protein
MEAKDPNQEKEKAVDKRGLKVNFQYLPEDIRVIVSAAKTNQSLRIKKNFSYESTIYLLIRKASRNGSI